MTDIIPAELGNLAGIVGAADLARDHGPQPDLVRPSTARSSAGAERESTLAAVTGSAKRAAKAVESSTASAKAVSANKSPAVASKTPKR
jgi:hypothetical protein